MGNSCDRTTLLGDVRDGYFQRGTVFQVCIPEPRNLKKPPPLIGFQLFKLVDNQLKMGSLSAVHTFIRGAQKGFFV